MGRAGKALGLVLKNYGINQNQLAIAMDIDRSNISRWIAETREPSAESVLEIRDALETLDTVAAAEFTRLYWGKDEING
ncbi:helix-turn-helix domain-containing protein [Leptolyngbya sp. AN03gr2]|uniref:helix-turn-helix domain-containing protein n=1 Tax=unclassified Leptolyngbya TaxID=2650499 RepID=UPI003D30F754